MKNLFVDVETTGTDASRHGIWQLSCVVEIDGHAKHLFNERMKPAYGCEIDSKALEIGGITNEDLDTFDPPGPVAVAFQKVLNEYVDRYNKTDKFMFIAYNALFDYRFVRKWWEALLGKWFGSYFWYPPIDVMILAIAKYREDRATMSNFKLSTVAKHAGLDVVEESLHDAKYDIELTRDLFYAVI